jgi:hypothetical protein
MLEIAGSDEIWSYVPMFFSWPFGLRGSAVKLCWLLPSCVTISCFMMKSVSGECYGSRDLQSGNGCLSLCGEVQLAW